MLFPAHDHAPEEPWPRGLIRDFRERGVPACGALHICGARADPDQMESLAIHMVGLNRLYFNEVEHVLDRKSLSTFPEHARYSKIRASLSRKTAHTFVRDALGKPLAIVPFVSALSGNCHSQDAEPLALCRPALSK